MSIKVTDEISLTQFEFWSGAADRAKYLTYDQLEELTDIFENLYPDGIDSTTLNDIFWFEEDYVAQLLGYDSWEALEKGNSDDDEDEDDEDWEEDEEEEEDDGEEE